MRNKTLLLLAGLVCCAPVGAQKPAGKAATTGKKIAPVPVESPIVVMARAASEVGGRTFTLGEIADITGKDAALITALNAVEIGTSPIPGQSRSLLAGDITVKLRAARLESKRVVLNAPPLMRISRAQSVVGSDDITKTALESVQDLIEEQPGTTVEAQPLNGNVSMPKGKVKMTAGAFRGSLEQGRITVPVLISVEGYPSQTVDVPLKIRRRMRVLIANRNLEPNDVITPDDVSLARIDLPPGFTKPVLKTKEAVGKRVRKRILADAPLPADTLEVPPVVVSGAKVTIEYVFGPVHITAVGIARQAGAIGDTIRVYSSETKREIEAVVLNAQTVRFGDSEMPEETAAAKKEPTEKPEDDEAEAPKKKKKE